MASHDSTYSNTAASGNSRQHNGNVFNTNYYGVAPELTAEPSTKKGHYARQISVEKYYTGRKKEAKDLAEWMIHSSERSQGTPKQARFVICGIGGSGKTQFCCKFAQSNRAHFWGIFWIDGRSHRDLKRTLSEVAEFGGLDANVNAALTWLTNLDKSWLLIIDNADDPDVDLEDYIPGGDRGHVLITTRNVAHTSLGNIGIDFFTFDSLRHDEAETLLLVAAREEKPYSENVKEAANKISGALGHLALAITVAAGSIRNKWCSLYDYLDYYKRQTQTAWTRPKDMHPTETAGSVKSKYESAEAAFDVSYRALEKMNSNEARDALHVLRTFAYLHCEDIRFEFVKRAITNAANDSKSPTPHTWSDVFSPDIGKLYTYLHKRWSRPILPDVFSETHLVDDPKLFRIRAALGLLQNMSLISHNTRSDTYTMHLLVHAWARKVPGIGLAEQAAWAECAATLLSNCISLASPSDSDKKSEGQTDGEAMRATERKKQEELKGREELRKQLLPHVDHVRDRQSEIRKLMSQNRESCKRPTLLKPWQDLDGVISRDRALMFAKFSIVYLEHGRFSEAEYLQSAVMEYTMRYLGPQHESTRRITLLLADTYIHISKAARAEELQTIIINACTSRHDKLVAQQKLAESRRFQGHLTDARRILREVVAGLTAELGELHEDTLDAIDALGRTLIAFYDDKLYLEARELHRKAYNGIRKIHGDDAIKTLLFCENFCMTAVSTLEPAHLSEALGMMEHVLQTRKEKLGREHAYTLLAMVNLARVQSGMGNPEAAEKHILHGLPIAQRNLGEDHIAYLWGRYELAKVMIQQSRWRDAEGLLKDNIQRQKKIFEKRGGHHPDVIGGLIALATALNALGRHSECERVVEEALHTLTRLSNADEDHPLATKLKTSRDQWRRTRDDASVDLGVGQTA